MGLKIFVDNEVSEIIEIDGNYWLIEGNTYRKLDADEIEITESSSDIVIVEAV